MSNRTRKVAVTVLLAAFALNVAVSLASALVLPTAVAIHFGPGGQPDQWTCRRAAIIFHLIIISFTLAMLLGVTVIMKWLPRGLVSLPNRDYWLAPDRAADTRARLQGNMAWFGAGLLGLLLAAQALTIEANLSDPVRLREELFLPALGLFLAFTVAWLVRFYRSFRLPPQPPPGPPA
jgi:uncharacterized membrane protein